MPNSKRITHWFLAAAETEANTSITVGATKTRSFARPAAHKGAEWLAFSRLVAFRRRQCKLSMERLAAEADVDLEEVVSIERCEWVDLEPRTVYQIARALNLPEQRLGEIAGLRQTRDHRLRDASVRFAARSEPIEDLRPEELEALEEYVKVLAET